MHPIELEDTRKIAKVRIHVERVIGSIKAKYIILQGTIPITMLCVDDTGISEYDKVVLVCCALVNLCPSMVPQEF